MLSITKRRPQYGWGLQGFRDEMDRAFSNWFDTFDQRENIWAPSIDIVEHDDKLELTAELPGVDKKDIRINVVNNVLTLEGEKKAETKEGEGQSYRSERYYGKFSRSFTLNTEIDNEKIDAEFKNGVLVVSLPKAEKVKLKQIEIK